MNIMLSEIDQIRFGIVTAKCIIRDQHDLLNLTQWCNEYKIELVIARVKTDNISIVKTLEDQNFRLMDTLIYYKRDLMNYNLNVPTPPQGYRLERDTRPNAIEMEETAALAFKGYIGHYHADYRLPKSKSDAVYSSWALNSAVDPEVANQIVSVYREYDTGASQLAAFATLNYKQTECEGVLFGVHPAHRQKGLHQLLIRTALACAAERGCTSLISSTQINNIQVQRNWAREGLLPSESYYTLHQWR